MIISLVFSVIRGRCMALFEFFFFSLRVHHLHEATGRIVEELNNNVTA